MADNNKATALINNYIAKTATKEELLLFYKTIGERLPELVVATAKSKLTTEDGMRLKTLLMKKMDARYISDKFVGDLYDDLKDNRKLNAVKLLKEKSGLGLRESKDVVDEISQFIKYT